MNVNGKGTLKCTFGYAFQMYIWTCIGNVHLDMCIERKEGGQGDVCMW